MVFGSARLELTDRQRGTQKDKEETVGRCEIAFISENDVIKQNCLLALGLNELQSRNKPS